MTSPTRALAGAVADMLPEGPQVHFGKVTRKGSPPVAPSLPWFVVDVAVPGVGQRSDAQTAQARQTRVLVRVAAKTFEAAQQWTDAAFAALDSHRPEADGWSCGLLLQNGDVRVYESTAPVLPDTDLPVFAGVMTFDLTCSQTQSLHS